jgi:hypothetical protein
LRARIRGTRELEYADPVCGRAGDHHTDRRRQRRDENNTRITIADSMVAAPVGRREFVETRGEEIRNVGDFVQPGGGGSSIFHEQDTPLRNACSSRFPGSARLTDP